MRNNCSTNFERWLSGSKDTSDENPRWEDCGGVELMKQSASCQRTIGKGKIILAEWSAHFNLDPGVNQSRVNMWPSILSAVSFRALSNIWQALTHWKSPIWLHVDLVFCHSELLHQLHLILALGIVTGYPRVSDLIELFPRIFWRFWAPEHPDPLRNDRVMI